jgi:nitrogenase molybdenum-iron protein beta chain
MADFVERPRSACPLAGALAAISALPEVAPVIHSAIGCGGALSGAASVGGGNLGSGYCSGAYAPASSITENEVVFGGAERLEEQIGTTLELIDARLYIVTTGCVTEMIGDDVHGVVGKFSGEGKPVIAVNTPSFKGDSYAGYEILLDGIFNHYLQPAAEHDPALVNLFGLVPAYDPFFRGDLGEIARLLKGLGLKVNTFFTPDQNFDNILAAPKAGLNIVFSGIYAQNFARNFQERHGTPYWSTALPIGAEAAARFLLELAGHIEVPKKTLDTLIEQENQEYYGYFARGSDLFGDSDMKHYAVTATNSNYLIPVASFLQRELGWVVLHSFVTDQLKDLEKQRLEESYGAVGLDSELIFETGAAGIAKTIALRLPENRGQRYFDDYSPLFILGSALERPTAIKRGARQLSISYPMPNRLVMDRGYAGYRGGLHLFEDLINSILAAP